MPKYQGYTNIIGECHVTGSSSGGVFKSKLERDGIIHWLLHPDVSTAHFQQPRVRGPNGHRYTGDIYVVFRQSAGRRPLVIECKRQSDLDKDPTLDAKHRALEPIFNERGEDFKVITDKDVFTADFPTKKIIWARHNDPGSIHDGEIVGIVRQGSHIALGHLLDRLSAKVDQQLTLVPAIWRLVARRCIFIDFSARLDRHIILHATALPTKGGLS